MGGSQEFALLDQQCSGCWWKKISTISMTPLLRLEWNIRNGSMFLEPITTVAVVLLLPMVILNRTSGLVLLRKRGIEPPSQILKTLRTGIGCAIVLRLTLVGQCLRQISLYPYYRR